MAEHAVDREAAGMTAERGPGPARGGPRHAGRPRDASRGLGEQRVEKTGASRGRVRAITRVTPGPIAAARERERLAQERAARVGDALVRVPQRLDWHSHVLLEALAFRQRLPVRRAGWAIVQLNAQVVPVRLVFGSLERAVQKVGPGVAPLRTCGTRARHLKAEALAKADHATKPLWTLVLCKGPSSVPSTRDKHLRTIAKATKGLHPTTGKALSMVEGEGAAPWEQDEGAYHSSRPRRPEPRRPWGEPRSPPRGRRDGWRGGKGHRKGGGPRTEGRKASKKERDRNRRERGSDWKGGGDWGSKRRKSGGGDYRGKKGGGKGGKRGGKRRS
ncbi:unnamed protein product [Prorocentrum cordatum]|uniref:Uncharacterized protein n=1 Tax=Prorocentrum cordatum TaxID=2364126 RepID=A0ABN9VJJ7_9DINO|nr:unnamed protein product [Polarella glacialis]